MFLLTWTGTGVLPTIYVASCSTAQNEKHTEFGLFSAYAAQQAYLLGLTLSFFNTFNELDFTEQHDAL